MEKVMPSPGTKGDTKHPFRFELKTHERTFFFRFFFFALLLLFGIWFLFKSVGVFVCCSAESNTEMTEWMLVLGGHIHAFLPSAEDLRIGGSMAHPDKVGVVRQTIVSSCVFIGIGMAAGGLAAQAGPQFSRGLEPAVRGHQGW
jgi:hypothetical protein